MATSSNNPNPVIDLSDEEYDAEERMDRWVKTLRWRVIVKEILKLARRYQVNLVRNFVRDTQHLRAIEPGRSHLDDLYRQWEHHHAIQESQERDWHMS